MINTVARLFKRKKSITEVTKSLVNLKDFKSSLSKENRDFLEKELFKLTMAYNISKEISGNFNLEKTLNMLVDRIANVMSVGIVSLMLVGKNTGEMLIKFAKGLDKEIIKNVKVKLGEGVSGWVAQTGQSLLVKDISKDPRFSKRNGKYNTNSLLSVPLKIQDKVIGVINVNNKISKGVFNEEDLDILSKLADLAALAVTNSRLREDTKHLDDLRANFIANVSHELRTPLTAIKESVGIILEEIAGNINSQQKKLLSLAVQSISRLSRLIDDLLDFSKVDAETREMKRTLFDIGRIAELAVATLRPLAQKKEVDIKISLPNRKIEIWGDEDKLYEVISNFIDNAIKYNKPKGKINLKLEDTEKNVKIIVSDTGIGMPKQDLDKIFDRFKRIEGYSKDKVKGSGLGLSIVKDIVEMHGGETFVDSEINKGTTFTVTLPKNLRIRR
ncbi:MAG: GAF domain-containing sensor histidine kinase [Candidatus Omnitrophica bacterium]|nr:GAF domain-containing sensor histidine kinase [Candidatus Omnitrophota bacterium]